MLIYNTTYHVGLDDARNFVIWLNECYIPEAEKGGELTNPRILRITEAYLIAAEAGLESGASDASDYLNIIRKRADPTAQDVVATIDLIQQERQKEFIGEGHRFFDVLRNGMKITRTGSLHMENAVKEIDWNYEKCVLPIPEDQFVFNPDMEQNPGYSKF